MIGDRHCKRYGVIVLAAIVLTLNTAYAQKVKVTISLKNVPMEQVMACIEENTRYLFGVSDGVDTKQRVTVEVKDGTLEEALDQMVRGTGVIWHISSSNIILSLRGKEKPASVTGKVTDTEGWPISGAAIIVKGTDNGTATDMNGEFVLMVDNPSTAVIEIACLGFMSVTLKVGNRRDFNISLAEDAVELESTVVTALGIR